MSSKATEVVHALNEDAPTFYGGNGTIHRTDLLDVEVHNGKVVSVWFRCMALPFRQDDVDAHRAQDMRNMMATCPIKIHGVEVEGAGLRVDNGL